MSLHLIMPMGGAGSRFFKNGYMIPKPLIKINEKPFFYWAAQSVLKDIKCQDVSFVVLKEHIEIHHIDQEIQRYFPDATIKVIPEVLPGPVLTCLKGIEGVNDDKPILFNDCDHMFRCSSFSNSMNHSNWKSDGTLLTFESNEPQFSYVKYGEDNTIIGTVEKKVVSNHAICGAYGFRNINVFKEMSEVYLKTCSYSEYFISGVYNVMCEKGFTVKDYLVDWHVTFGTPEEYEVAKDSKHFMEINMK